MIPFEGLVPGGWHKLRIAANTINGNGEIEGRKVEGISVKVTFQGEDDAKQCTLQIQNQDICEVNWNGLLEYIKPASEKIAEKDQSLGELHAQITALQQEKSRVDQELSENAYYALEFLELLSVSYLL